ncbi:hypothetical protein HanXRQr2_Chr13g0604491 [Helianthus annuus]|uniref:Uncharacterized protein n=1 Tax=Helianthus annuus TaxID=4232 RepID=A0A9K3HD84_HELAN|nr:hypothetical protein HanXRQr2_Chr13g0604491 [Helianthus annuus]KAJ0850587.1 hypothetical protein HanPSC8_Chr13g0582511 [Helianthus annuus]
MVRVCICSVVLLCSCFMSALDFVKSDDTSDVVLEDVAATPGEDAIARGSEHRFEGSGYVSVPNVKGFTKVPASKVSTRRLNRHLKSADQPSSSEAIDISDDIEVFVEQVSEGGVEKEKEKELCYPFYERDARYDEVTKKKDKMKASMASMKKEIDNFAKKEEAWVKKMHEVTSRHEVEVEGLKKEMDALKVQEKTSLKEQGVLKADNRWLIEHGFQQGVTYLFHSSEFNQALGVVYTKLLAHGRHQGLVAGYKACEAGEPQDKSPHFQLQALKIFQDSVRDMEHMTWPFVGEVYECFDKPLSVLQGLKPHGLNKVACKKVLESLSKKRSCSGDSEETMSAGDESSKEGSLEASEAASEGRKKKKAKKSRMMELWHRSLLVLVNGAVASKPSGAGFVEILKVSVDGC